MRSMQAFRYGGFGTHELVKYYDLVRELLWSCWEQLEELADSPQAGHRPEALSVGDFVTMEVPRLLAIGNPCFQYWRSACRVDRSSTCRSLARDNDA